MIQHLFITHETKSLLFLRRSLIRTLNNNACVAVCEPVSNTIAQIEAELKARKVTFR